MINTYPLSKLSIPAGIVVMRGTWFRRENLVKSCEWMKQKLEDKNLTVWERKFFKRKLEETQNALDEK